MGKFITAGLVSADSADDKKVNYTADQTAMVIAEYTANPTKDTVSELAVKLGKTTRSIIAKLSREKVYIKPVYTTKTGGTVVKKDTLIDTLESILGLTEPESSSFIHVNKTALMKIIAALGNIEKASVSE